MGLAFADYQKVGTLRNRLRKQRFQLFLNIFDRLPKPARVLDVGGTIEFWRSMDMVHRDDVNITLLNLTAPDVPDCNITSLAGDARDLSQFSDHEFDIVFSNSVIEHVGGIDDQRRMAREVQRVGKNYVVQTPNRFFPIEPHVQFPLFQFLPREMRIWLHRNLPLATYPRARTRDQAIAWVDEIRLLSRSELATLFPQARIVAEKFLGLDKSYTAVATSF